MLNQNENSDYSQNKEQANQVPHSHHSSKCAEPTRRIGTATMGVTLVVCGVLLICFFFKPFDLFSLMKFSPILLILLGIETLWQYFRHKGENLRYDFMGTFFSLTVILVAGCFSVFYPLYMTYGPANWKVEEQVCGEIENEIYQQLPENIIEPGQDLFLLYRFESLDDVIHASRILNGRVQVVNSLYQVDNQYYILAEPDTDNEQQMNTCGIVWTEFAPLKAISRAQKAYMEEHHDCIIAEHAMETLAKL